MDTKWSAGNEKLCLVVDAFEAKWKRPKSDPKLDFFSAIFSILVP